MYQLDPKDIWRRLPKFLFVDLIKQVSRTASETLLGGGIDFKHKNPEIHKLWHEFVKENKFETIMWNTEEMESRVGIVYLTLNRTRTNDLRINIAQPYFTQGMGYSFANEELAVMYERFEVDNKCMIIRSVYDKEKTVRTVWDEGNRNRVDVMEVNEKLPRDKQIKEVDYHHFGFVPVFAMYNRPFFPFMQTYGNNIFFQSPWLTTYNQALENAGINALADWANCSGLPILANYTIQQFYKELSFAKTRIVSNAGVNSYQDNSYAMAEQQFELLTSDFYINKNGGEQLTVQQNQNHFVDYQESYDYVIKTFFKWCGYSYVGDSSSAQKTTQESYQRYDDTLRTLVWKREFHGKQWTDVIIKIFKAMGINLEDNRDDWSFEIRRNAIVDQASLTDTLIKWQQAGLCTRAEMLATIKNIDLDYAQHLVDYIDEQNKKENITPSIMAGAGVEGVKGANFQSGKVSGVKNPTADKGGRPNE